MRTDSWDNRWNGRVGEAVEQLQHVSLYLCELYLICMCVCVNLDVYICKYVCVYM